MSESVQIEKTSTANLAGDDTATGSCCGASTPAVADVPVAAGAGCCG